MCLLCLNTLKSHNLLVTLCININRSIMIKALAHHKLKNEDKKTSSVIGQLLHLPAHLFWQILRASCLYKDILPLQCGEILDVDFWPSWSAEGDDIENKDRVEPDVFIRFDNFDLIIEAKVNDTSEQSQEKYQKKIYEQRINEVNSYLNEYEDDKKSLYFIALGGCATFDSENIESRSEVQIKAIKSTWTRLLHEVWSAKESIERQYYHGGGKYQLLRIIEDVIEGFAIHGVIYTVWLNTLPPMKVNSNSINLFRNYGK